MEDAVDSAHAEGAADAEDVEVVAHSVAAGDAAAMEQGLGTVADLGRRAGKQLGVPTVVGRTAPRHTCKSPLLIAKAEAEKWARCGQATGVARCVAITIMRTRYRATDAMHRRRR